MKKVIATLVLIACASLVCAQVPEDVPSDHWAYDAVNYLMQEGYVIGFPDGSFAGNRTLTRYEFASIIKRVIDGMNERVSALESASGTPAPADKPMTQIPTVEKQDLALLKKLVDEFKPELVIIGTRLDKLETQLGQVESTVETLNAIVTDPEGAFEGVKSNVSKLKKVTVGGYVQSRYQTIDPGNEAKSEDSYTDTYIVRRARIKVTAKPTDRSLAVLQLELGKNAVSVKDSYFGYSFTDLPEGPRFYIGQLNWPFGYEVPVSSSVREAPERVLICRRLFPGERDQGAKFQGSFGKLFNYQIGLFNGTGIEKGSSQDRNDRKDIIVNVKKLFPDLEIGASYYGGAGVWQTFNTTFLPWVNKSRYGADLQYYYSNLTFKAEYFKGRGVDQAAASWDQSDFINGGYGQLAFNFTRADELVARWSTTSADPVNPQFGRVNTWDLGYIRWLDDKSRVKLFYKLNHEEMNPIDNNGWVAEWIVKY